MNVEVAGDALLITPGGREAGRPLAELLIADLWLPEAFVSRLFTSGRVWAGRRQAYPEDSVKAGDRVRLLGGVEEPAGVDIRGDIRHDVRDDEPADSGPAVPDAAPSGTAWPLPSVLYEDDHLMVVDKPAGILIYPGSDADQDTLAHRVAWYFAMCGLRRKVRHVHRLDRDTTGAVLYAKHAYSARALDLMMSRRLIHRRYLALAAGRLHPPAGEIRAPIGRDRHVAGRYRVSRAGREAVTHYRTRAWFPAGNGGVSLVELTLDTGRTHQIRVHLAYLGHPVVGDALYGGGTGVGNLRWTEGQALHAVELIFVHPYQQREISVQAPLPKAFADAMEQLGQGVPALDPPQR
ncbi:MAG: RluA family pseudouridine synthase [Alicyclobacillus sp.]|nr:RluA family pseudouridine synthase [Alicyclobacillus sp.]